MGTPNPPLCISVTSVVHILFEDVGMSPLPFLHLSSSPCPLEMRSPRLFYS